MRHVSRLGRGGAAIGLALLIVACSAGERPQLSPTPVQATDRAELEAIATLLDNGEVGLAKKRIAAALKRDRGNASLMMLRDSIDRDPRELLGPSSYLYTVRPGDTIAGLAQRLLGNRLKSHQLARYNGIEGQASLSAGQMLRIPGETPRAEPVKRPERSADPQTLPTRPKPTPAPRTASAPAAAAASGANPAAARQARSAGLAALNEGHPGRAVALLSRAAALDPGNAAIGRDLKRAKQINATVQARQ